MQRQSFIGFMIVLAFIACARRETALPERPPMNRNARVTPADLAGCYGVEIGPWLPEVHFPQPADVELTLEYVPRNTATPAPVRPGSAAEYRLRLRDGKDQDSPRTRKWTVTGPSDAEIRWSSDSVAVDAHVTVDRRTRNLAGTVKTITEQQRNQSSAPIRFVRKPC